MWAAVTVRLAKKNDRGFKIGRYSFDLNGQCQIFGTRREALKFEREQENRYRRSVNRCKLWFHTVPVWVEKMPMHGAFTLNLKDEAM